MGGRRRLCLSLLAMVMSVGLTGSPALAASSIVIGNTMTSRVLTPDQGDSYTVAKSGGTITMQAPATNVGTNFREVYWPASEANASDSRVCTTWTSQSAGSVQEGVAMHIVDGATSTRAVTVTKNVIYGIYWVFNVHTWDSSLAQPFTQIAQFDMGPVVTGNGDFLPLPWRVCARTIGAQLQFKIWLPNTESEPAWTNTTHVGTTTVPADYLTPGKTGWYVGHIPPGGSAQYNNLGIWQ